DVRDLPGDVAARFVVLAAAELIRGQMQPARSTRRPAPPARKPTAAELEVASRAWQAVVFRASASAAAMPGADGGLAGPALSILYRNAGVGTRLFARWYSGAANAGSVRWLEAGLAADYAVWFGPSFRLAFGTLGSFATVHLADARAVDSLYGDTDT